jgi:hypothetical protein
MNVKRIAAIAVACALFATAWASVCTGTGEWIVEALQPISVENGVVLSNVTYVAYLGDYRPGTAIDYTARANLLTGEGGTSVGNRNAANLAGIEIRLRTPDWSHQWFGAQDTVEAVSVELDCSHMKAVGVASARSVLEATIECVLTNAAKSRPRIRNVRIVVVGSGLYKDLNRNYRLASLGALPRRTIFDY